MVLAPQAVPAAGELDWNGLLGALEAPGPLCPHSSLLMGEVVMQEDMTRLFVFTAAKSLLNKKSDGGVKVGISPVL